MWWISAVIRREREFAADESVVKLLENSHLVYASALASLEEHRQTAKQTLPRLATAANGGNLMQRITKILQKSPKWTPGVKDGKPIDCTFTLPINIPRSEEE